MAGFLDRLRQGLGLTGRPAAAETGGAPVAKIVHHFRGLAAVSRDLPEQIAQYIVIGDNSSVLSTLQNPATHGAWVRRPRVYPAVEEAALLSKFSEWPVDSMRRMGEILAALDPIKFYGAYFGTEKSPDWLRHAVTVWLDYDHKAQPIEKLLGLVSQSDQPTTLALDILLCRSAGVYRSSASV